MSIEGNIGDRDVNIHNADSGTGIRTEAESISVALSTEQKTSLDGIKTATETTASNTPTVGQKPSSESSPVVLASDQVVPVNLTKVGSSSITLGQKISVESIPMVLASDYTLPVSTSSDQIITGSLAALGATVTLPIHGVSGSIVEVSGTWAGTIVCEGSNDGFTTLQNITLWTPPTGFISAGVTVNGYFRLAAIAGFNEIRARMIAWTSGSATVKLTVTSGVATIIPLSPIASAFNAQVVGASATGVIATPNPLVIGGLDSGGTIRTSKINADGSIDVSIVGDSFVVSENISQWGSVATSLGQKLMASSVPVVLSSDQTVPVSLPLSAATSAKQDTGNTSLASIDSKIPANPSQEHTTPGSASSSRLSDGTFFYKATTPADTQPISASSLPLPSGAATEATLAAAKTDLDKLTFTATRLLVDGSGVVQPASQSGTWSTRLQDGSGSALSSQASGGQRALDVGIDVAGVQVDPRAIRTLTSSDIVTAAQGSAAAIASAWPTKITDGTNTALVSSGGGLVVAGLSAPGVAPTNNPVSVSGVDGGGLKRHFLLDVTGKLEIDSISGTISLPTGASTAGNQTTANTSLASVDSKLGTLGQKAMAGSAPVVIASDQSAIPSSQSGTWNINNVSGTISLPTGAATSANQTTANTSLSSIDGKLTHGQVTMANSVPVVMASDQSPLSPPADLSTSGTITALNGSVSLAVHGVNSAIVSLSGVWVATIQFQGMTPDGNWSNLTNALLPSGGVFSSAAVSAIGSYRLVSAAGYSQIRATATAFTSGTVTVAIDVAAGQYVVQPVQLTAANFNSQVVGNTADGAAWTGNSVVIGGKDGSGNAQSITSTLIDGKQSIDISIHPGNIASYMASTNGEITTGTALNTVNSIAYLWHPNSVTKRYEIALITASINSLAANVGYVSLRGVRITALNGAPGGTNQTIQAIDQADAASGGTFTTGATGAPTRAAGDYSTNNFGCAAANNNGQSATAIILFDERIAGKPLVLRASQNEGYEVRTNIGTALTVGVPVSATFYWREV